MDCLQSIQLAVEYMEDHMFEGISYEDVSRHVYMSNYHFHRLFHMIAGITATEYIRNRKLSMAGQELIMSEKRVIDIALKYGYDSPEAFTKAFSRFHGVSPNVAKHSGRSLRFFHRLVIKIELEGGKVMEFKIVEKEKFKVLAKVKAFRNECTSEDGNTEIHDFWDHCRKSGVFDVLKHHTTKHDIFGVCAPISKESTHFDVGIGMIYDDGEIPEGFRVCDINPILWAVFKCIGSDGGCIGETWDRIFNEFLPGSDYNMLDDVDFEYYPDGDSDCFCEIWIPVEKKQ